VTKEEAKSEIEALRELVKGDTILNAQPQRLSWANERWLDRLTSFERHIRTSRHTSTVLRSVIGYGALLVPILATASATAGKVNHWRWLTVLISSVVALCTAIDQVYRPGVRWQLVLKARNAMQAEGWSFLERAGQYAEIEDDKCFARFFGAVEALQHNYDSAYLSQVAETKDLPRQTGRGTKRK
jgi:hypothetical protein